MIREVERTDPESLEWTEVREERISHRRRWSIRAAQWRTLELAREVFGEEAGVRLDGIPPRGGFQGMVHVRVPFDDLDDHRARESRFTAMAGADELLTRVPMVFIFEPDPDRSPPPAPVAAGEPPAHRFRRQEKG